MDNPPAVVTAGGTLAAFVYGPGGERITGTVGATATVFVGAHYEVQTVGEEDVVRKHYYAGGQRVAMREDKPLYFLLADHLGSQALTVEADGTKFAEVRYKAWGEDRYTSGATPTTSGSGGRAGAVGPSANVVLVLSVLMVRASSAGYIIHQFPQLSCLTLIGTEGSRGASRWWRGSRGFTRRGRLDEGHRRNRSTSLWGRRLWERGSGGCRRVAAGWAARY